MIQKYRVTSGTLFNRRRPGSEPQLTGTIEASDPGERQRRPRKKRMKFLRGIPALPGIAGRPEATEDPWISFIITGNHRDAPQTDDRPLTAYDLQTPSVCCEWKGFA
jgi:hypothetical protein